MDTSSYSPIGVVSKSHGLKGEVSIVFLLHENPNLDSLNHVFLKLKHEWVPFQIQSAALKGNKAIVKFEGINSIEEANSLKGSQVFLSEDQRDSHAASPSFQYEDFQVVDEQLGLLGKVKGILLPNINPQLVIPYQNQEILIPVHAPFILSIDSTSKTIHVSIPDGLLEI